MASTSVEIRPGRNPCHSKQKGLFKSSWKFFEKNRSVWVALLKSSILYNAEDFWCDLNMGALGELFEKHLK